MSARHYKHQCDFVASSLKAVVKIAVGFLDSATVKASSPTAKKLKLVLLHGMCRKAASLIVLYEARQFEGIEEIGRSIFEGYVDLENLQNDPKNYANYLLACSEWQKFVFVNEHDRRDGDPHSAKVIEQLAIAFGESISEYKSKRMQIVQNICKSLPRKYVEVSKQGRPMKPRNFLVQKAKWAGLETDYNGFYRLMSPYSHHDISSLILYVMGPSSEIEWPPKKGKVPSFNALYVPFVSIRTSTIRIAKSLKKFNGPLKLQLLELDPKFD